MREYLASNGIELAYLYTLRTWRNYRVSPADEALRDDLAQECLLDTIQRLDNRDWIAIKGKSEEDSVKLIMRMAARSARQRVNGRKRCPETDADLALIGAAEQGFDPCRISVILQYPAHLRAIAASQVYGYPLGTVDYRKLREYRELSSRSEVVDGQQRRHIDADYACRFLSKVVENCKGNVMKSLKEIIESVANEELTAQLAADELTAQGYQCEGDQITAEDIEFAAECVMLGDEAVLNSFTKPDGNQADDDLHEVVTRFVLAFRGAETTEDRVDCVAGIAEQTGVKRMAIASECRSKKKSENVVKAIIAMIVADDPAPKPAPKQSAPQVKQALPPRMMVMHGKECWRKENGQWVSKGIESDGIEVYREDWDYSKQEYVTKSTTKKRFRGFELAMANPDIVSRATALKVGDVCDITDIVGV